MKAVWEQTRSFSAPTRLLMANQFAINLAFYMLMPYLAAHLAGPLGLAAWAVGLVLGVRNFSQQGMFLVGGTIADRFGYKAPIMAGCLLRTAGFGLLGWVDSLPALIAASAATGFAGALFNPAVRAYLAAEAGERRVDAFATFNVYYQAGMPGPALSVSPCSLPTSRPCARSPPPSSPYSRLCSGALFPTGAARAPTAPPARPRASSRNGDLSSRTGRSCCSPAR
ncbi:Multidrug resistance protein MdtH [Streptomyces microflavus]